MITLVFYDSLVEKTNCRNTAVFQSCYSFSLLPPCIDAAYTDFLNKLMKVIKEIAPSKEIRIKNNSQDWFHREVADLIHVREKLLLMYKKSKLQIDQEIYKKN